LILDAGCGLGATVDLVRRSDGIRAVGLDMDFSRLVSGQGLNRGRAVAATLPLLPFRPESFQGIFCECVLSLVPEKGRCLEAFFRALAPEGSLILADIVLPGCGGQEVPSGQSHPATCLDGALTLAALTAEVERAGFCITGVEDHTRLLREMACEMVFEYGSLDRFWQVLTGTDFPQGQAGACRTGILKPGYVMVMATKGE